MLNWTDTKDILVLSDVRLEQGALVAAEAAGHHLDGPRPARGGAAVANRLHVAARDV
jgi:hypothetical protein